MTKLWLLCNSFKVILTTTETGLQIPFKEHRHDVLEQKSVVDHSYRVVDLDTSENCQDKTTLSTSTVRRFAVSRGSDRRHSFNTFVSFWSELTQPYTRANSLRIVETKMMQTTSTDSKAISNYGNNVSQRGHESSSALKWSVAISRTDR